MTHYREHGLKSLLGLMGSFPREFAERYPVFYHDGQVVEQEELLELAESTGRLWVYGEGRDVTITGTGSIELPNEWFERMERTYDVESSFVRELPDAHLVGGDAVAFTSDDRILLNSVRNRGDVLRRAVSDAETKEKRYYLPPSEYSTDDTKHVSHAFPLVCSPNTYSSYHS